MTQPSIRIDIALLLDAANSVEMEGLWPSVLRLVMLVSRERL